MKQIKSITNQNIISALKQFPNQGILWEIIENQVDGKIFQLPDNVIMITENGDDPFIFIAGKLSHNRYRNLN